MSELKVKNNDHFSTCFLIFFSSFCVITNYQFRRPQQIFSAFLIILSVTLFMFWFKLWKNENAYFILIIFVQHGEMTFLLLAYIFTICNVVFLKPNSFKKIMNGFKRFNVILKKTNGRKSCIIWLILFLAQVPIVVLIWFDICIFVNTTRFWRYLFRDILICLLNVIRTMIYWLGMLVCSKLNLIKESLEELRTIRVMFNNNATEKLQVEEIKRLSVTFGYLCDILRGINDLYGATFLLDVVFSIFFSLEFMLVLIASNINIRGVSSFDSLIITIISLIWVSENSVSDLSIY